ncbi:glucose-6-phosphate 1-dehydrogenase [Gordonia hirsuta DSM 44140 = NBRC 16056]|uniref:Glucose-6-phosphate 1-dehydrogenase n=1 Tax=Gordonia hirsuta DSM 44140 = NBRC 16056 TaxID=1121927 RepID=L7LB73_9ACTN|nr:glucose-6-phosphate dehydrogenase [Gordonia hirsuta]GAC57293.1 glucose-6-phosphate 1-dehydrogenase [Gordonia hirsuta DSM 44140 = NBRC 16056]
MSADRWRNPLRDPDDRRLPQIAGPCALVVFGVTGDLSRKKLMPAVYDLANRGLLPPSFALVGFARREWSDAEFADTVKDAVREHTRTGFDEAQWERLAQGIRFVEGSFDDDEAFDRLKKTLTELDIEHGTDGNHAFYLAIPPNAFPTVLAQLKRTGMAVSGRNQTWQRVVIEKPFGHDLHSARELNALVNSVFPEESVFRIDHYLGKETVQNILALRFANQIFEPLWNSHYIDHVQITMAEDIGLGGRAGYYDGIGAARDVIQNHLMQLLALVAMEEPISFSPRELQVEKIKVLSSIRNIEPLAQHSARGQYGAGWQGSEHVDGLVDEGFPADSTTETFAAIAVEVDTRRWAGVPFYLRTGKRLGRRVTEIALVFKRAPHLPFDESMTAELGQNAMVIRIQPDEGVNLRFGSKVPGTSMEVRDVNMDFSYGEAFTVSSPEAYERLLLDVMLGEPSLFPVNEEVELSWSVLDPVLAHWAGADEAGDTPEHYAAGTWGPECADEMLALTGRVWRRP